MPDVELGKRIYREGILPSGKPIKATVQGDVPIEGTQLSCASCHRLSGFGSNEGGRFLPPVTGPSLYQEKKPRRADLIKNLSETRASASRLPLPSLALKAWRSRPAYTDESLAIALREGRDPSGHELDPLMPRYALSDEDMGHLVAYLKTLSAKLAPGVDKTDIHFATVVTDGVPADKRKAMLDVIQAYFDWKNYTTEQSLLTRGFSHLYKDSFLSTYRKWVLHVWELEGPQETWNEQLKAYYRERPVFALLSGINAGDWRPVHDFCESAQLPCIFPNTDLPVVSPKGAYNIHFSKGLTTEAEALAQYLSEKIGRGDTTPIVQVFRDEESGAVPARALRSSLKELGITGLHDHVVEADQRLTPDYWKGMLSNKQPAILILWLKNADVQSLVSMEVFTDGVRQICLSYNMLEETPRIPLHIRDKIYITYPYTLPQVEMPQLYRIRGWMKSRAVKSMHERLQINTHYALSVADHALSRLLEDFSQDYFVESVEHKAEEVPNPGIFPHLSLGVGQRFASKGSYIVKLSDKAKGGLEAISDWIIP
jgi:hypothetical protein